MFSEHYYVSTHISDCEVSRLHCGAQRERSGKGEGGGGHLVCGGAPGGPTPGHRSLRVHATHALHPGTRHSACTQEVGRISKPVSSSFT